jgi:26S proteasome regulatory subunit N2
MKEDNTSAPATTTENVTEEATASSSTVSTKREREKKPSEPTSETLHNFSRVTPSQLAHIVFPPDNRFQPVRAVASHSTTARSGNSKAHRKVDRYAGGGGILVLVDTRPEDGEPELVLSLADSAAAAAVAFASAATAAGLNVPAPNGPSAIAEDENTVEPPAPFEVSTLFAMLVLY